MDHERFRDWFSRVDELTAAQRKEVAAVLSDPPEGTASLAAIELGVDDERRCPHCGSAGCGVAGQGARSAPLPVQGLREDIRRAHRHGAVGAAPQGALAGLRRLACRRRDGKRHLPSAAGLRRARRIAGVTASWRRFAKLRTGLPGSSRPTRPSFSRAGRGSGSWTASRAGAAARPANAASRASRCRSWSPPTVPARPSAIPFPPSTQRA